MRNKLVIIFILLLLFTTCVPGKTMTQPLLNKDLAKLLVNQEWKLPALDSQNFLVLYSLYFEELEDSLFQKINFEFEEETENEWTFSTNKQILELISTYCEKNIELDLNQLTIDKQTENLSWLITMEKYPVTIRMAEKTILQQLKKTTFELSLLPLTIDNKNQRILTRLIMRSESSWGSIRNIQVNNWIQESATKPILILTRKTADSNKHFALFLTAIPISPEIFDTQGSYWTIGNLLAINKFIATNPKYQRQETTLYIFDELGLDYNFYKNEHELFCNFRIQDELLSYRLNYSYFLPTTSLALSGQLDSDGINADLRWGITDQMNIDLLQAKISYLPVCYSGNSLSFHTPYWNVILNYQKNRWKAWYEGIYLEEKVTNRLGIGYLYSPEVGINLLLEQKVNQDLSLHFGLNFIQE